MTGYKNRSVSEIHRPTKRKRAQRGKGISSRLNHCLYHSELIPMRYPAKIAHSGMIYYFWLLRDFSLTFTSSPFVLLSYAIFHACKWRSNKKRPDKIQVLSTPILRQALLTKIFLTDTVTKPYHLVEIRSVRTIWFRKLTAITDLHSGHLIFMIPTVSSGFASNNLLFLQHGHATCISCIYFRLP